MVDWRIGAPPVLRHSSSSPGGGLAVPEKPIAPGPHLIVNEAWRHGRKVGLRASADIDSSCDETFFLGREAGRKQRQPILLTTNERY
jgi:hypothetical protein